VGPKGVRSPEMFTNHLEVSRMHTPASRPESASQRRADDDQPVFGGDPVLSFQECADDYGCHLKTWRRHVLPTVETVDMSPGRRGVRRSVHEASKRARARPPSRQI
jgi:hypothetical protein